MPVLTKTRHDTLKVLLRDRYTTLARTLEQRDLKSAREGCTKGSWVQPELLCATNGTSLDLRVAVEDFKTILEEIKKLK